MHIRLVNILNLYALLLGIMAQDEDLSTCFCFEDEDPMNKEYVMENCADKDIRPSFSEKSNVNPRIPTTFDIGDELPEYSQHDDRSINRMNEILDGIDMAVSTMEEEIAELNDESSKLISELANSVDKLIFEIEEISDRSTGEMGCTEQESDEFFDAISNRSAAASYRNDGEESDEYFDVVNDKTIMDDKFKEDVCDEVINKSYNSDEAYEAVHEPDDVETVGESEYQNNPLINETSAKPSKREKKNINDQSMELVPEMSGLMNFFNRIRDFLSRFLD